MKKAFVFDLDNTLIKTDCRIGVSVDGRWINSLTPEQFNTYELKQGERFDFSDFDYLINPVALELLEFAIAVHNERHDVYILTARNSKARNPIMEYIKSHGINAKEIYCVGDNGSDIAKEKRTVMMTIIENYDKTFFYDDCERNIENAPVSQKFRKYKV